MLSALRLWSLRRWLIAAAATVATVLVMAVPTALIETPVFGRAIPPTAWAWPVTILASILSGLLVATYVREPGTDGQQRLDRPGTLGGLLAFFAVGCPVCNKLVLLALGTSGALQWFAPAQPYLAAAGLALLAWALRVRLRGEIACPVPSASEADRDRHPVEHSVS